MYYLYSLVTIEDPDTPLAPAPQSTWSTFLPWITGAIIVLILVLVWMATVYVMRCNRCMRQISYISETHRIPARKDLPRWNLKELNTIREEMEDSVLLRTRHNYS